MINELPILTDRTRKVLRENLWGYAFGYGRGMSVAVWYSKIDGTVYGLGSRNPNLSKERMETREQNALEGIESLDTEEDCMRVRVDRFGLVPEEIDNIYLEQEVNKQICGNECEYAKERVLEQIRLSRDEILAEKRRK